MDNLEINRLIVLLAKIPGFGPKSAKKFVLYLLKQQQTVAQPLIASMQEVVNNILVCSECNCLDTVDPCAICSNKDRNRKTLCIIADVSDMWSIEKLNIFDGYYYNIGGLFSINKKPAYIYYLERYLQKHCVEEIILALAATIDGQTTTHYIMDIVKNKNIIISKLALGMPAGGEIDYLDDITLEQAIKSRNIIS